MFIRCSLKQAKKKKVSVQFFISIFNVYSIQLLQNSLGQTLSGLYGLHETE